MKSIYEHFLFQKSPFWLPGEATFNFVRENAVAYSSHEEMIAKGLLASTKTYVPELKGGSFTELSKMFDTHLEEIDAYEAGIVTGMHIVLGTVYSLTERLDDLALLFFEAQERTDGLPYFSFLQIAITKGRDLATTMPEPWGEIVLLAHMYRTDVYFRVGVTVGEVSFLAMRKTIQKILAGR